MTRRVLAVLCAVLLCIWAYPHVKALKWREQARIEWREGDNVIQQWLYVRYMPDGEIKQLGEVWKNAYGWDASEFNCGILFHRRTYATKEMAMKAVEKWCK